MGKGFEKMQTFFKELPEEEILLAEKTENMNRKKPIIDMSWIFTEKLDREVIKKALANIMAKNNPSYKRRCENLSRNPEDISEIKIIHNYGRVILQFSGNDDWTKLNVTDKLIERDNDGKGIHTISLEQLEKEIYEVLKREPLDKIIKDVKLEDGQIEQIITLFNESLKGEQVTLAGVEQAVDEAFSTLVDYYNYLIQLKKEHNTHSCTIVQRCDEGGSKTNHGGHSVNRLNPIIPFEERSKHLESKKPITKIEVEELIEDKIVPNSYTVYVYENCLQQSNQKQDGYLFVAEPLEGNRNTRMIYLTKEEFENYPIAEREDKFSSITSKYLSMSTREFEKEEGSRTISHTKLETYKERIDLFIDGIKGKSITNPREYEKYLRDLYKNKDITLNIQYRKTALAEIAEKAKKIDRTAQHAIGNEKGELQ